MSVSVLEQRYGELIAQETIQGVVDAIAENFSPDRIIVFGSYACGRPTRDSDLDLLIVMRTSLPRHKRAAPIRLLFRPTPCSMEILVYTPEEVEQWNGTLNHIITEAFRWGKVVYERPER